ncbi:hypothetical protein [Saccharolobus caldissimus]|uniref:Uncharacterized protein n=1 Tax=Saccharolobus caldissimus TaxID=1702097 RepID=A0AAQ4CP41_9CREN|nr:hypothetical protein [Saccharolobus caldissimus]BDB97572.1 hypothetical protein SACC_05890 [Saccharolobus caldissimus]
MNESDREVSRILLNFETVIEDHTVYLNELENLIVFPEPDVEKATRLIRKMRRVRRELSQGLDIIAKNIDNVSDLKIKEEALGLVNYLVIVGFKDEKDMLTTLNNYLKSKGIDLQLDKDIEQITSIINRISHLNF